MLTGSATPYLFNGIQEAEYSDGSQYYETDQVGLLERNYIGFLIWDRSPEKTSRHQLGSRYKTPHLPIWVTCVNNQWGVLFNPRLDLMKSHSAENRLISQTFRLSSPIPIIRLSVCLSVLQLKLFMPQIFSLLLQWKCPSRQEITNSSDNRHERLQD